MGGSAWYAFTNDTGAKTEVINADEVNSNFDWSEGHIVPHLAGVTADSTYDLGEIAKRWRVAYLDSITLSPTARYYQIAGLAFRAIADGGAGNGGVLRAVTYHHVLGYVVCVADGDEYIAEVQLPHGASIENVTVYTYNGAQAGTRDFQLRKKPYAAAHTDDSTEVATDTDTSTNAAATMEDAVISELVDNNVNFYWIKVKLYNGDFLKSCKIIYLTTNSLP